MQIPPPVLITPICFYSPCCFASGATEPVLSPKAMCSLGISFLHWLTAGIKCFGVKNRKKNCCVQILYLWQHLILLTENGALPWKCIPWYFQVETPGAAEQKDGVLWTWKGAGFIETAGSAPHTLCLYWKCLKKSADAINRDLVGTWPNIIFRIIPPSHPHLCIP